jgi:hypothetical protein
MGRPKANLNERRPLTEAQRAAGSLDGLKAIWDSQLRCWIYAKTQAAAERAAERLKEPKPGNMNKYLI